MVNNMKIDDKIITEIQRYNSINKYVVEQALPGEEPADAPPVDAGVPPADSGATPPPAPGGDTTPIDTATDPDVEKIDDSGKSEEVSSEESGSEELDITDLVNSQKTIETKQDEYFQNLFSHLENLETKLSEMDKIVNQLNSLEQKIEKYIPKSPKEKLELRSLDSGPYNQKLSDFFVDKEQEMEKSGKNEYVLTTDDVEEYSPLDISRTFRDFDPEQLPMR
jgi:hypothetical protein